MLDRSFLCTLVMIVAITNTLIRVVAGDGAATSTYSIPTSAASSSDAGDKPLFPWWDILTHGTRGDAWKLCDPRWWFNYIVTEFRAEPAHATVETICILTIIYLIVLRKPAPLGQEKLTKKVRHTRGEREDMEIEFPIRIVVYAAETIELEIFFPSRLLTVDHLFCLAFDLILGGG